MFSVYLSVGSWQGFKIIPCDASLQLNMGYLSMRLANTDFERLVADILRSDSTYSLVKKEFIHRIEDRLLLTLEDMEESTHREAELELKILELEHELDI